MVRTIESPRPRPPDARLYRFGLAERLEDAAELRIDLSRCSPRSARGVQLRGHLTAAPRGVNFYHVRQQVPDHLLNARRVHDR
jgi:hypothetical protein